MHRRTNSRLLTFNARCNEMTTVLIVLVVLMLLGAFPSWNHSKSWGYGPSGGLGLVLVILVILMLSGRV